MKKILMVLLLLNLTACKWDKDYGKDPNADTNSPTETSQSTSLRVGSFNIQVFGVSKMSDSVVVNNLVKILGNYDLVLIQEIRDASGSSIVNLLEFLNAQHNNQYKMILSARAGRSSSKEQYAFFYRQDLLESVDYFDFSDTSDLFEREPLIAYWRFTSTGEEFFTFGLHAKPEDAFNELQALYDVYYYAEDYYNNNKSIIMGDFNSDCSYLSDSQFNQLKISNDNQFRWQISKSWDTTSGTTNCAYDQFITTGSFTNRVSGVHIFNFQQNYNLDNATTDKISDHYPIGLTISF